MTVKWRRTFSSSYRIFALIRRSLFISIRVETSENWDRISEPKFNKQQFAFDAILERQTFYEKSKILHNFSRNVSFIERKGIVCEMGHSWWSQKHSLQWTNRECNFKMIFDVPATWEKFKTPIFFNILLINRYSTRWDIFSQILVQLLK